MVSIIDRHSGWSGDGKQVGDGDLELRDQFLRQDFAPGEDAFEGETPFRAMINLHVIVSRIHDPQARHADFFIDFLLGDGIRLMISTARNSLPVAVVTSDRSGQSLLSWETRTPARGASNCVPVRPLSPVAIC